MISVIVPIYNSEKYLSECLDSLIHQTYQDLEIILVDDGSQDQSANICSKYAEADKRITVICQENRGSTKARKEGLKASKGEYISFIDSDDWVDLSFYERLYDLLILHDVDMVVSGCIIEEVDGAFEIKNKFKEGAYIGEKLQKEIYPQMLSYGIESGFCFGILQYMCNKLYKRNVMESCVMELDERIYDGEDAACVFDACLRASGIYIDNHSYYHYRIHGNSVCTSPKDEKYFVNAVRLNEYMGRTFASSGQYGIMVPQLRQFMEMFINNGTKNILGFHYMKKLSDYRWKLPVLPEEARRICIFGAGRVGRSLYGQLFSCEDKDIVAWADSSLYGARVGGVPIIAPESLLELQWDLVIIAVKDEDIASEMIMWLQDHGVLKNKILWEPLQSLYDGYEIIYDELEGGR